MTPKPDHIEKRSIPKCPICAKSAADGFQPFCSRRCADVDLNRWLSGGYVVPGKEDEDEDGSNDTPASDGGYASRKGDG